MQRQRSVSTVVIPLSIFQGEDAPLRTPAGYSKASREVNATGCKDLSAGAKIVLYAIVGTCWNDSKVSYASVDTIAKNSGFKRRATTKHLSELEDKDHIRRERDFEKPGSPWKTVVLIDPSGKRTEAKLAITSGSNPEVSPRTPVRDTAHARARHRARPCADSSFIQGILFPISTLTEEPSSSIEFPSVADPLIAEAVTMFPQLAANDTPARSLLVSHGPELFAAALAVAGRQRKKSGPSAAGKIRWLVTVLENFQRDIERGLATVESIRAEAGLNKVPASPPVESPEPTESGPVISTVRAEWWAALRRGDADEAMSLLAANEDLPSAQEIGRVSSAKTTTRPIGALGLDETIIHHCANGPIQDPTAARPVGFEPTTFGFEVCGANISKPDGPSQPRCPNATTATVPVSDLHHETEEKPADYQSEGFSTCSDVGDVRQNPQRLAENRDAQP
jgi:hypothetical protein